MLLMMSGGNRVTGSERQGDPWHVTPPDTTLPNAARIYDFLLGGKDNFTVDREAAARLLELIPDGAVACQDNRQFLGRAVRYLTAERGIRQFIDIGTGLPTQGNVHEIAQGIAPEVRVVYVDYDPIVITHANALLAKQPSVIAHQGDLREPEKIIGHPAVQDHIDFSKPLAILLVAVMHFVTAAENPGRIAKALKDAMPPGSYLVLTHITADDIDPKASEAAQRVYQGASAPVVPRSHAEIMGFFEGLALVEPGVVNVRDWRPTLQRHARQQRSLMYGGVGLKRR